MSRLSLAAVAVIFLFCPSIVSGSEELVFQVAQPAWTEEGVQIFHVMYAGYPAGGWCSAVDYTCRANAVVTDMGVENRNAANRLGLSVRVTTANAAGTPEWDHDTLKVEIDANRAWLHKEEYGDRGVQEVVEKTVSCILENASLCFQRAGVVQIRLLGAPPLRTLEGTYRIDARSRDQNSLSPPFEKIKP